MSLSTPLPPSRVLRLQVYTTMPPSTLCSYVLPLRGWGRGVYVAKEHSFSLLHGSPLYQYAQIHLPIHLLWAFGLPSFWVTMTTSVHVPGHVSGCAPLNGILYLGMGCLDQRVCMSTQCAVLPSHFPEWLHQVPADL